MTDEQSLRSAAVLGAIIIPAHNEAAVLARTLSPLAQMIANGEVEVIVAANGCTDQTAEVAAQVAGVRVVQVDVASKTAALNYADQLASHWPRIYLDADVSITADAVRDVFDCLSNNRSLAARPSMHYDTHGSSYFVRSYYRARSKLPENQRHLWGAGTYGLSRSARERFEEFPALIADDVFVDLLFSNAEKTIVDTEDVVVYAPTNRRDLLSVMRRSYRGNRQLQDHGLLPPQSRTTSSVGRQLVATVHGPRSLLDAGIYLSVVVQGRLGRRKTATLWERDESRRVGSLTA